MNKFYKLFAVVMAAVLCFGFSGLNAQEVIWSEDFSNVTNAGTQQCDATNSDISSSLSGILPGWSGSKVYEANGKLKMGTGSAQGYLQTPSIDLSTSPNFYLSFDAKAWKSASESITLTVYVNETPYTVNGLSRAEGCDFDNFQIIANGGTATTVIRFEGAQASNSRFFIDNIVITSASGPAITFTGDENTSLFYVSPGDSRTRNYAVKGFNLDAAGTTNITIDNANFSIPVTSIANNELMSDEGYLLPITFTPAQAGMDTAHITFTNSDITVDYTVLGSSVATVSTIAELRSLMDYSNVNANTQGSDVYMYTGTAIVTQKFLNGSNNKWIQDETGAIQLYDFNNYYGSIDQGCAITNIVGSLTNYYGYLELTVRTAPNLSDIIDFPDFDIEPLTIDLGMLRDQDFMTAHQAELMKLEGVTFNATGEFERYGFYTVTQGEATDTAVYVTSTYDNCVGAAIPTAETTIVGVNTRTAAYSAGYGTDRIASRYYILPRNIGNVGIAENAMSDVKVYPNPTSNSINIELGEAATNVAIYNIYGKLVGSQAVSAGVSTVSMSNLTAGVYIIRIFNDNNLVGTAKVVKE